MSYGPPPPRFWGRRQRPQQIVVTQPTSTTNWTIPAALGSAALVYLVMSK
jgi:hypothetical protein